MRKETLLIVLISIHIVSFLQEEVWSYDDRVTHPDLTKEAIDVSMLSDYLKSSLGFSKGRDQIYNQKTIIELLQLGSTNEDEKPRGFNHFHNPINDSGLDDEVLFKSFRGESNLDWARGYSAAGDLDDCEPGEEFFDDSECNAYSWRKARASFYQALTSNSQQEHEEYFALFCEQLGRILHLLEDSSVPAHTRNDFKGHLSFREPGDYFIDISDPLTIITGWFSNLYEYRVEKNPTLVTEATVPLGYIPDLAEFDSIEKFWDQGKNTEWFPSETAPDGEVLHCGLAEYANTNFLSKCSMFPENCNPDDRHFFPFPRMNSVEPFSCDKALYLLKTDDGDAGYLLARAEYWYQFLVEHDTYFDTYSRYYGCKLDNAVHDAYANRLIPRTIGYTAGLINYFFRGTMEIAQPDGFFYGFEELTPTAEDPDPQRHLTQIMMKVRNSTGEQEGQNGQVIIPAGEEMSGGNMVCVARYRLPKDTGVQFPSWDDFMVDQHAKVPYSYSISAPLDQNIPTREFQQYTFDFTMQPIPANVYELELLVVYRGQLGQEEDAVAVGRVDVCEPATLEVSNVTDFFDLLDEPLCSVPGDDFDGDGEPDFSCSPLSYIFDLTFSDEPIPEPRPAHPHISVTLNGGEMRRYLILQDRSAFWCRVYRERLQPPSTQWTLCQLTGVRNQEYLSEEGVVENGYDVLQSPVESVTAYRFFARTYLHRDRRMHYAFITPTMNQLGTELVLSEMLGSPYSISTNEWDLGQHAAAGAEEKLLSKTIVSDDAANSRNAEGDDSTPEDVFWSKNEIVPAPILEEESIVYLGNDSKEMILTDQGLKGR